jgi:hypothetical protein
MWKIIYRDILYNRSIFINFINLSCIFVVVVLVFCCCFLSIHLAVVNEFIFILCCHSFVALTNQLFKYMYSINEITLFINFRPIFGNRNTVAPNDCTSNCTSSITERRTKIYSPERLEPTVSVLTVLSSAHTPFCLLVESVVNKFAK